MRAEELVALGGLLHDIGKPVQRAGMYSGDHSKQGAEFLRELAAKSGREEYELLALFSEFHHRDHMNEAEMKRKIRKVDPERFGLSEEDIIRALWLVYEADNLSSAETDKGSSGQVKPLYSIFNPEKAYRPVDLNFKQRLPIPENVDNLTGRDYEKIVADLKTELKKINPLIDRLLPVLERHLTFVGSANEDGNVISLYDHMRMTSAIALAMFRAGCTVEDVKAGRCKDERRFLLIEGDFSGIQDFIYGVTGKGTLKYLRARSAYLELIGWDIVLEILRRLGLTRANVVFNAGGHFLIVAQNTEKARRELENIRGHVAEWLYHEFDGKLYLALEWEAITGEELSGGDRKNLFSEARKRLKKKLALKKLRCFEEVAGLFNGPKNYGKLEECAVCRKELPEEELEPFRLSDDPNVRACRTCNELAELGKELPKVKGFILDKKAHEGEAVTTGPFRYFVPHYTETLESGEALLLKNTLEAPGDLPETVEFIPYLVADYFKPSEENKHSVAEFTELAKNSTGTNRLGVLKGDVDNLGLFFGEMDSPSKLATASRFMDYFFKAYLSELIRGNKGIMKQLEDAFRSVPSLGSWPEEPDIVVVYAGGDDFFLVGAWDQVFGLAFRIREAFKAYTGQGRTLSMGIGYFTEKTPIYRMAEVVSERLERAKKEGKNRVFVVERTTSKGFPMTYEWEHYVGLWNTYGSRIYAGNGMLKEKLESKKGLLWRVLEFRELYVRNPNSVKWAYLIAYLLGRHGLPNLFPELVGIDVEAALKGEPQPIYWVDGVLKIVLMAVRG